MAVHQIDAASCTLILTLCLWMWTRLKLPAGCFSHENLLRRQNILVFWAFSSLTLLQLSCIIWPEHNISLLCSALSAVVFYLFATTSQQKENGFWSRRRNHAVGLVAIMTLSIGTWMLVPIPTFAAVLSALLISHICRKRYVQILVASIKDLEAIQAKLIKQESHYANIRNFDNFSFKKSS